MKDVLLELVQTLIDSKVIAEEAFKPLAPETIVKLTKIKTDLGELPNAYECK